MRASRISASAILLSLVAVATTMAADRVRIVSEGGLDKDWAPAGGAPLAKAGYPAQEKNRSRDVCINLGYQVNKDGSTSDFSLLRAWSSDTPDADAAAETVEPFVQAAAAAVSTWHYEPTPDAAKNRVVYSSTSVAFVGDKGGNAADLSQRCAIPDLRAYITKLQNAELKRGNLERAKLETHQRENTPGMEAQAQAARRSGGG